MSARHLLRAFKHAACHLVRPETNFWRQLKVVATPAWLSAVYPTFIPRGFRERKAGKRWGKLTNSFHFCRIYIIFGQDIPAVST
jgi:hypothetical protein